MADFEGQEMAIARVYAGAMLGLAQARNETDQFHAELLEIADRVETNPDFARFLSSPLIDTKARRATLEKLFRGRYSDLLVDSLQVMNSKDRLGLVRAAAEAFRLDYENVQGRIEVHVRTAVPLPDELRSRIKTIAKEKTGKDADLVETVDESLIGGLVMRIGDLKFDASIATKLKTIAASLLERASHEVHGGRVYFEGTTN